MTGLLLCVAALLSLLMMVGDIQFFRGSTGNAKISLDIFNMYHDTLRKLQFSGNKMLFAPLLFLCYIIAVFHVRLFGIVLMRDYIAGNLRDHILVFLLTFVVSGYLVSEMFYIGFHANINDSLWFVVQGLMGSWLLFGLMLRKISSIPWKYYGLASVAAVVAIPTTIQFLVLRYDSEYAKYSGNAMEVIRFLDRAEPHAVVLHPPNYTYPSLASNFAGQQSVINLFRSFVTTNDNVPQRIQDVLNFFAPTTSTRTRIQLLSKYRVDYVYAPVGFTLLFASQPGLEEVLRNKEYVLYKVI